MSDDNFYFGDQVLPKNSVREWVGGGEGHVPLEEARQRALTALQDAEAELARLQEKLDDSQRVLVASQRNRDNAYEARQRARVDVKKMQQRLAYVCSTPEGP